MTEKTAEIFDKKVIGERVRSLRTSANNPKKKEKNTGKKTNKTGYSMDELLLEIDLIMDTNDSSSFISKSTICNIENGKSLPSPELVAVLSYLFETSFNNIILGNETNFKKIVLDDLSLKPYEIGLRIYQLRNKENLALRKFSKLLNQELALTSYKTCFSEISKIESGKILPPLHYAYAISQYFNVSLDFIYFGK